MNPRTWTDEEREEYERICEEAWRSAEGTPERAVEFDRLIADAEQAHQRFAADVAAEARHRGLAAILKAWHKRRRTLLFSYRGEPLTKSAVIGVRRVVADGVTDVQALIHAVSFEELRTKRIEFLQQLRAYSANVAFIDRALALADLVPAAATPQEALESLGTSVEEWFADVAENAA